MNEIIRVLKARTERVSEEERIRLVYNEAIDDAANFLRDLAPHNAMQAGTLLSAEREVRRLTLEESKSDQQPDILTSKSDQQPDILTAGALARMIAAGRVASPWRDGGLRLIAFGRWLATIAATKDGS